jgi:hypothetical protein
MRFTPRATLIIKENMAIINPVKLFNVPGIVKRYGKPNQFGQVVYGWSWFGNTDEKVDVYHRRHLAKKRGVIAVPYMFPENPQSEGQQTNRAKFSNAVASWQNLTDEEKNAYNELSTGTNKSGYNIFISRYMDNN